MRTFPLPFGLMAVNGEAFGLAGRVEFDTEVDSEYTHMMICILICKSAIINIAMARNCEIILVYNRFDVDRILLK